MKQLRLLAFLLALIVITGITSIDTPLSLSKELPATKEEVEKVDKDLKEFITTSTGGTEKLQEKITILEKKSSVDAHPPWIIPLLFTLNIATLGGLVYLVYRTKKISETAKTRNNSIKDKLSTKIDKADRDSFSTKTELNKLVEKQQKLEFGVSSVQREISTFQKETKNSLSILTATIRDLSSRTQNTVSISNNQQSHDSLINSYPSENIEPAYLTDYNNHQKNFADTYRSLVVVRDLENYNLSRAGQTEDVILAEENRGNYWLFSHEEFIYVVPSQKFKITDDKLNEVKDLFDCQNYQESNYNNYILIKPALVSKQINEVWRLKEKGILKFA